MDMKAGPIQPGVTADQPMGESSLEKDLVTIKACVKDFKSNPTQLIKVKLLTTVISLFQKFDLSVPQTLQDSLKKQVGKLCNEVAPNSDLMGTAHTAFKAASRQCLIDISQRNDYGRIPTPLRASLRSDPSDPKALQIWKKGVAKASTQPPATVLTPEEKALKKSQLIVQHGVIDNKGTYSKSGESIDPHALLNANRALKYVLQAGNDNSLILNYRRDPKYISHAPVEINDDGSLEIGYRKYGSIDEFVNQLPYNQIRSHGISQSALSDMLNDKDKKFALEEGNDGSLRIYLRTDPDHVKSSSIAIAKDGTIEVAHKMYPNFEEFLTQNNLK